MTRQRQKPHYAWMILAACCALQGGTLGLIQNSCGIFYRPICDSLGFELSAITLYTTIRGLASCAVLPLATAILRKKPLRITLSVCIAIFTLSNILMGFFNQLWQWYVAGAIQGMASAFLAVVTVPIVLGNWFNSRRGFAIGFASAFSGVLGMLANPLGSMIISAAGWRACYVIFGVISLLMILPFTLFVFRFKPEEMGLERYGEAQRAQAARKDEQAGAAMGFIPALALLFALQIIAMFTSAFSTHLSSLGTTLGLTAALAAMLASLSMAGNMTGKFALGALSDRFGVEKVTLVSYLLPMLGFLLLLLPGGAATYAAALLTGVAIPAAAVMMPLLIRSTLGDSRYDTWYSNITLVGSITYSLGGTVFGWMYDASGGYLSSIVLCAALMAIGTLIALALWRAGRAK